MEWCAVATVLSLSPCPAALHPLGGRLCRLGASASPSSRALYLSRWCACRPPVVVPRQSRRPSMALLLVWLPSRVSLCVAVVYLSVLPLLFSFGLAFLCSPLSFPYPISSLLPASLFPLCALRAPPFSGVRFPRVWLFLFPFATPPPT